jgi:hypothetical protein
VQRAYLNIIRAGQLVEVGERARIGRDRQCELHIDSDRLSRQHAEVCRVGEGFEVRDLGSSGGTFLGRGGDPAQKIARTPIFHGDQLYFGDTIVLFTLGDPPQAPPDARLLELEARLRETPNDGPLWAIYGDVLLERGDSRGQRIAQQSREWGPYDQPPLWASPEHLDVRWLFGHAAHITVRGTPRRLRAGLHRYSGDEPQLARVVEALLASPLTRFLQTLHLDLPHDRIEALTSVFAQLGSATHPTLRKLTFGPFFSAATELVHERPMMGEYLAPREKQKFGAAWLAGAAGRFELNREQGLTLTPELRFSFADRRWRLLGETAKESQFVLNGLPCKLSPKFTLEHLLMPGDVIEAGGRTLRFEAQPEP